MKAGVARCWLRRLLVLLVMACLAGCKPQQGAGPTQPAPEQATEALSEAPAADNEPDEGFKFLSRIHGVWASAATADAAPRTVFVLGHVVDHVMDVSRNGIGLDLVTEKVDPDRGTVTFRFQDNAAREQLTFGRTDQSELPAGSGSVLRVTYADGRHEDLFFVRGMSDQDIQDQDAAIYERPLMRTALGRGVAGWRTTRVDCAGDPAARARSVCRSQALRELDDALARRFESIDAAGGDAEGSRKAALAQLDACADDACRSAAYRQWIAYLDANFSTSGQTRPTPG